ncbi:MAG TPA: extracellular solute-binding protein [Candidatus Paceibacterota bacterium]|nr:extracellular solute-binding protein [Candidatus Paceibacterota bacterium]
MKELRPFQIVLLAIFGLGALIGLYVFATFGGFGGSKVQVGEVLIWGTLPSEGVNAGIDALAQAQTEYAKVTYVEVSEYTFDSDLAEALASGAGPDLVIVSQEMLSDEKNKLDVIPFTSISERTYLDSYLPIFELFLTPDGTYGLPLVVDPLVLYYNRSILASAGIASAPSTWEAVSGLAPSITKRTDGGAVSRSLISLGEYSNVMNARGILSLLLLQAGSPITEVGQQGMRSTLADSPESAFGTSPAQSAVNYYAQFADPAKTLYSWNRSLPNSRSAFIAGDLVLYPGYASEQPFLSEANPNLDYDMAPIPVPATLSNRLTYGKAYAFAIPKASANRSGAYAAANALSASNIAATIAKGVGMAPARRASLSAPSNDKYATVFYREALVARGWLSPAPSATDAIFSAMISDITSGRRNVEQALGVASRAITEEIQ